MGQYAGYEKQSAVERAMEQIVTYITDVGMADGERLPNERELAEQIGVGRSTLREALQRLCTRNVFEVKRGVGTFVSYKHGVADDPLGFTPIRDKERLAKDLIEFRIMIEPHTAALAAQNATKADIYNRDCLRQDAISRGGQYTDLKRKPDEYGSLGQQREVLSGGFFDCSDRI